MRNLRANGDRQMQGVITTHTVAETVAGSLKRAWGDLAGLTKRIGRRVDADPRAVRNWLDGTTPPQTAHLIRLMGECDELLADVLRLAGRDALADLVEIETKKERRL